MGLALPSLALAAPRHGLALTFGSASSTPADPEPLAAPSDIAVNEATGDVYVTDTGNNRVEYFTNEGTPVGAFNGAAAPAGALTAPSGIAIDNDASSPSHGDVYVVDSGHDVVVKFSPTGEYLGEVKETPEQTFGFIAGIAVDPTDHLWVAFAPEPEAIATAAEFDAEGSYVSGSAFNTKKKLTPGLAVDSADHLYILTASKLVRRLTPPQGEGEAVAETNNGTGVAADENTGNVYADQGSVVFEYGQFGEPFNSPIEEFGTNLSAGAGLTVNATNGTVYVTDSSANDVEAYSLGEAPAEAPRTEAPTNVEATTADFHGELNPGGMSGTLDYQFDYATGPSCAGGQSAPTPPGKVTEAKSAPVETPVAGLKPATDYTYCLAAFNAFGKLTSTEEASFTTTGAPPAISEETSTDTTSTTATLAGAINPENQATTYHFEYSTSETLSGASSVGEATLAAADEAQRAGPVELTGLAANTTYYYRLVAANGTSNGDGTSYGPVESFLTAPMPPTVTSGDADDVTATTARIAGVLDGMDAETHYFFEYGLTASYGSIIPENAPSQAESAGIVSTETAETVELTGLTPNTTYHFQLVVFNAASCSRFLPGFPINCQPPEDIAYGQDREFTTLPLAPGVTTDPSASVSMATARLTGRVVPQGAPTSYRFEYGTSTDYGQSAPTEEGAVGAASETEEVTAILEALQPSTTYHFRLVATNPGGTTPGADETFTTNEAAEPDSTVPAGFALTGASSPASPASALPNLGALSPIPPKLAAPTATAPTSSQALAKALKACRKDRKAKRRRACEKQARKRAAKTKKGGAR